MAYAPLIKQRILKNLTAEGIQPDDSSKQDDIDMEKVTKELLNIDVGANGKIILPNNKRLSASKEAILPNVDAANTNSFMSLKNNSQSVDSMYAERDLGIPQMESRDLQSGHDMDGLVKFKNISNSNGVGYLPETETPGVESGTENSGQLENNFMKTVKSANKKAELSRFYSRDSQSIIRKVTNSPSPTFSATQNQLLHEMYKMRNPIKSKIGKASQVSS